MNIARQVLLFGGAKAIVLRACKSKHGEHRVRYQGSEWFAQIPGNPGVGDKVLVLRSEGISLICEAPKK